MLLSPHVRPRVVGNGALTVRLVWRNRPAGLSAVVTFRVQTAHHATYAALRDLGLLDASEPAHV